ncbi:MAG: hypothetical protein A3F84_12015 [Candidatus Handelsmanbacteria bacterium RIFCSPLOWO2_12_FULL_64_10]|uniref:Uncharacterized protein n=1 Tax=Handelsmanbacteria sp. (strain RIFCSPLOWO2_12_FULL_64_10) TaxID=1817868 RepID=A0A1F6CM13_HANXR|nr:MAG: hypothetical protein A3F84_12015 [Candidatus Handelsmanbacteria bacterium RIFCSPLOWO2_12_FULL_64_10]
MVDRETFRRELIGDFNRLSDLIVRYAKGDYAVRFERDLLTEVVQIKTRLMSVPDAEWDRRLEETQDRVAAVREAHRQRLSLLGRFRMDLQDLVEPGAGL